MTVTLAIPHLYDAVAAHFAAEGAQIPMLFGWREAAEQLRSDVRIVWIPGDPAGNLGRVGPPKYPSKGQLLTVFELVTVQITAAVTAELSTSRAQYQRVTEVRDQFLSALHRSAVGTYSVTQALWMGMHADAVRRWGASIKLVIEVQSPVTADCFAGEPVLLDAAELQTAEIGSVYPDTVHIDRGG